MRDDTLRWGIIGGGKIAHDFVRAFDNAKRKHQVSSEMAAAANDQRAAGGRGRRIVARTRSTVDR